MVRVCNVWSESVSMCGFNADLATGLWPNHCGCLDLAAAHDWPHRPQKSPHPGRIAGASTHHHYCLQVMHQLASCHKRSVCGHDYIYHIAVIMWHVCRSLLKPGLQWQTSTPFLYLFSIRRENTKWKFANVSGALLHYRLMAGTHGHCPACLACINLDKRKHKEGEGE